MRKADFLHYWRELAPDLPLRPQALGYRRTGSTYGHDGLRVEGSPEFVAAVLSRLKPLLDSENDQTRLAVSYGEVTGRPDRPHSGGEIVAYIKVHERGPRARLFGGARRRAS